MSLHGDAAAVYAARSWRVVPAWPLRADGRCACPKGDDPDHADKAGKHPRVNAWQNVATCDPETVAAWWEEMPESNISIATGAGSGMFVIDVDPRHGGLETLERYRAESQFGLPRTLTAQTGSGGYHFFYRQPAGVVVHNATNVLHGFDVRGDGGQVVAPPSRHWSGAFYTWADCWEEGPQDAPEELLRLVLRVDRPADAAEGLSLNGSGSAEALPSADEILQGVPEGERNSVLFRWACKLRTQLGDDRGAVEVLVRTAAAKSGLGQDEASLILSSAFAQDHSGNGAADVLYGVSEAQMLWAREAASLSPDGVVAPLGLNGSGPVTGGLAGEAAGSSLALPLTDDGNSLRFVREFGPEFRYVPQSGAWLRWDGRRWAPCGVLEQEVAATAVARGVWREVADIEDKDTAALVERWAKTSQMRGKISDCLAMVRPKLAVASEALDADDWALNVRNGTLDLRTGALREHQREDLLTHFVDTVYDPAALAAAGGWLRFVEMVLPDPNVRWFVQKAVGYSLTGVTDAKAMFILYGSGSNGKSVFLEAIRENVIGTYGGVAPKTLVMMERDEHATQLAGMQGMRFVTLSEEVAEKDRLRTSTLKSITGGDMMTARYMRQDFFNFTPKLKLWIATNHKPGVSEFGDAMRTRLRLVPFTETIPEQLRRPREDVLAEFRGEAAGLLAWAVEGLAGWREQGLESPSAMVDAVDDWFEDEDVFGQWVTAVGLVSDRGTFMRAHDLHHDYQLWMMARGEERFSIAARLFGKRMIARGFRPTKLNGARGYFVNYVRDTSSGEES